MNTFTGAVGLSAYFDGEALVIRDEDTKGVVLVEAKDVIDFLSFLSGVVSGAHA